VSLRAHDGEAWRTPAESEFGDLLADDPEVTADGWHRAGATIRSSCTLSVLADAKQGSRESPSGAAVESACRLAADRERGWPGPGGSRPAGSRRPRSRDRRLGCRRSTELAARPDRFDLAAARTRAGQSDCGAVGANWHSRSARSRSMRASGTYCPRTTSRVVSRYELTCRAVSACAAASPGAAVSGHRQAPTQGRQGLVSFEASFYSVPARQIRAGNWSSSRSTGKPSRSVLSPLTPGLTMARGRRIREWAAQLLHRPGFGGASIRPRAIQGLHRWDV
jgi:hypothetical protein